MRRAAHGLTKGEINRAGDIWRRWAAHGPDQPDINSVLDALATIVRFRAAHQYPLTKATMGLRSAVKRKTDGGGQVSQRLKRLPTVLDKLRREPGLRLARMQDIGGCRAVLPAITDVRRVEHQLRTYKRWKDRVVRVVDYIETPRSSGYRGVHVIVNYDGCLIEMQLRTRVQHDWAVTVERVSGRTGVDLKSGDGPPEVLNFFRLAADVMADEEAGNTPSERTLAELEELRTVALQFASMGGRS